MAGLIATIILTLLAVKAAQKSAKSAADTLAHAKQVSGVELRPWVSIRVVAHKVARFGAAVSFDYDIICKNHGPTVARCYQVRQLLALPMPTEEYGQVCEEWWRGFREPEEDFRAVLMPGEEDVFQGWKRTKEDRIPVYTGDDGRKSFAAIVVVSVFYRSEFDEGWQRTDRAFTIGHKGDTMFEDFLDLDKLDLSADQLIARPFSMSLATQHEAKNRA